MALNIEIQWHTPVLLSDGRKSGLIYACDLDMFPDQPGVYVFGRQWGDRFTPLYIGQATRLRRRVRQQLEKNVKLMMGVRRNVRAGTRQINYCTINRKPGQQIPKILDTVEKALVEHALTSGFDLINQQGTSMRSHNITCLGRKVNHHPFPRGLKVRIR